MTEHQRAAPDPSDTETATDNPADDSAVGHSSTARFATARALRRLAHAMVAHQADDRLLEEVGRSADELTRRIEAAPERTHALLLGGPRMFLGPEESPNTGFPDGLVTGRANPMGFGAGTRREGDEAVLTVTLGSAFEGAPGRAHGGVVATLIDKTMGMVLHIVGAPAFTGRLTVNYRAGTPLNVPLEARSRMAHRDGRKLMLTAELRHGDTLLADADAIFVVVDPERFFPTGP